MLHAPVLAVYAKPRLSKCPNTDGASAVRPWICLLFTWSGLLLTALVSLYCACNARETVLNRRTHLPISDIPFIAFQCHEDHRSFRLFKYFWFEHALKPARWPHFDSLPLPVQLLGSAQRLSLDALSMVLLFCGKRFFLYPLDGAQVWARLGGLPILVSGNLDAPARDTGCLHRCSCHFVPVDDNLCFHSWGELRLGDPPGILGLET
jgi:hypothetical protein